MRIIRECGHRYKLKVCRWLGQRAGLAVAAAISCFVFFAPTKLQARELDFRGQKITVEGLQPGDWEYVNGEPNSGTEELILIYKDTSAPGVMTLPYGIEAQMLLVGGGGAGGYGSTGTTNPGGGGGGGQVLDLANTGYSAGTYSILVGAGGAQTTAQSNGENGHPSTITNGTTEVALALGGGGGGAKAVGNGGDDVATGGGGGGNGNAGGVGALGEDYKGGAATKNNRSGGGGGAGGSGDDSNVDKAGDGGVGLGSDIWADVSETVLPTIPRRYGGGGGGGQSVDYEESGAGVGKDGGGHGGYRNAHGADGQANTGGGGGGGGRATNGKNGGAGGSGIVIIRITYIEVPMVWKEIQLFDNGKIFVDKDATWTRVNPSDLHSDIIITYSNALARGGLRFFDPEQPELPPVWANARILAVGGGGGGMINARSNGGGGGGGAGGFLEESGFIFSTNVEYSITVGKGGKGGTQNEEAGGNGENSSVKTNGTSLLSAEAIGGGGGGAHCPGANGGSGGGGSRSSSASLENPEPGGEPAAGQGSAGGKAGGNYRGAGGGGAGGPGGNSDSSTVGAGGAGKTSDISGKEVWYAAGGGGAFVNANNTTAAKYLGGAGGGSPDGTVVIGGAGAGVDGGATGTELNPVRATSGVDNTGSGGGGGVSYANANETAGDGGSGIVIIRLSGFVVQGVPKPKATDFTYDGVEHCGILEVPESYAYELSGDVVRSNANAYTVTARIKDIYPDMMWADTKDREPRTVQWTIHQLQVEMPGAASNFVYNARVQTPVDKVRYRVDENGYASVSNATSGLILTYCHLEDDGANVGYERTDAGDYTVKAVLYTEPGVTNFIWIGGPDSGADRLVKSYEWHITQAPNRIGNFYYPGYRAPDRIKAHHPTNQFDVAFGRETTKTAYREEKSDGTYGDWQDWGTDGPSAKGNYEVRVAIDETKNWQGTTNVLAFGAWEKWSDIFTDRMDVKVRGTGDLTVLADFPVPVRVKEPEKDGYDPFSGFAYVRAGATGKEVRFFDANGDPVEHEVDVWNTHGESLLWVRVPTLGKEDLTLTMCWRRIGGIRFPDYDPARVWTAYAGVWHFTQQEADGIWADSTASQCSAHLTSGAKVKPIDGRTGKAVSVLNGDLRADNAVTNATGTLYVYDQVGTQNKVTVQPTDELVQLATGGQAVDEARFYAPPPQSKWLDKEKAFLNRSESCTCGLVRIDCDRYNDDEGLICDYWTTKPLLAKTVWHEGEDFPAENKGDYKDATTAVTATYRRIPDGEPTAEHPTARGHYRATYDHTNPDPYRPQPHTIEFYIIEATVPVHDIGGNGGDSGRVLLMNADNRTVKVKGEGEGEKEVPCTVTNQGWCARSETGVTYWRDCPSSEGGASTNNVMPGTAFELVRSADTNVLWRLYDCRQGNTFPTNDNDTTSTEYKAGVYLPPSSSTALSITNEDVKATRGSTGWVLMRNVACPEVPVDEMASPVGACVYSPCYSNGIGTIYFDAVNSRPAVASGTGKNDEGYKLVLEVATSTTNGLPPYDENSYSTDGTRTNWYGNLIGMWKPVEMSAMTVNDAKDLPNPTNCLALAVKNGGQTTAFYRIHARVDVHTPCRFRIRRVSVDDTPAVQDEEGQPKPDGSYILLDNIIASFPPVAAELKPYGRFDPALGGVRAVGYGGAFETPFPSAAEGSSLTGRCTVAFTGDFNPDEETFSLKQMLYRWRYLEQLREPQDGDWKAADLQEAGDELRTAGPLEVPAEAGDVEFHFVTILRTPYYGYVDYTGLDKPVCEKGYTEEGLPHESRYRAGDDEVLASGGRDWFIRLRDGRSRYEGLRLLTRPSGGGDATVTTNDFELAGDDQWTVRLRTRTAVAAGLDFRIEGLNPQTPGAREYAYSTDCWRSDGPVKAFPARVTVGACAADEWGWLACDAATGWLYLQLDLGKMTLQAAHAEAEDFSKWSSAVNDSGLFVGSAVDTNTSSAVTREYDVNMADWTASAASDPVWLEDFTTPAGIVTRDDYPRNEPFSTARSRNGWTAESAMWTYGKWSLQNDPDAAKSTGDDSAVQLMGLGQGRLSFINASKVPDGLDTVTYRARVGQVNDFRDFAHYEWYLGTSFDDMLPTRLMNDYTFATIAALTETGAESYDGDGSVSLVGLYNSDYGCYEFRVSRGTNDRELRLALFRWNKSGGGYVCTPLYDSTDVTKRKDHFDFNTANMNADRLVKTSKTIFGGLFLSVRENGGKTYVTGGVCEADVSTTTGPEAMSGRNFTCITYRDSSASRLSKGTFGLLSCNCPAVFAKPICYRAAVQSVTASSDNVLQSKPGVSVSFDSTAEKISGEATDSYYDRRWEKGGRMTPFTERKGSATDEQPWGFRAAAPEPQTVKVQVSVHGESDWQDVHTDVVKGFTDREFRDVIHDPRTCDVRLQTVNSGTDARTDVIVNEVSLTQWNGQWTPNWDTEGSPWYGLTNKFVYTSAWVLEKSGRKSVRLQPSRAKDGETPVSLRSPLMRGLGLVHFTWRDADPRARIRVQYKENATLNNIVNATKTLASGTAEIGDGWVDFETVEVGAIGASGSKTVSLNRRYAGKDSRGRDYYYGLIRLVIDKDVQEEAISGGRRRTDADYGAVTVTDMFTWDLPEYDASGWNGWNFQAAGWDGTSPDGFANRSDAFRGLAGILNNTLDADTLADREKDHYAERLPSVQSPAFRTNSVGAISFRARLFDADDLAKTGHGAVVTVYGCKAFDEKGEPTGEWKEICDIEISNRTYAVQSVKVPGALDVKAIRLAVKGVKGVTAAGNPKYDPPLRVALDDIVIWERLSQSLAFRKHYVRPFRDATAIKGSGVVQDIAEMAEQPLAGESFGFQAEVEVLDPDEVIVGDPAHPITVDLWYYQGGDVWGYENWKTNPAVVKVTGLAPATDAGDRLVFRSTVEQSASLCPPQFLEEGEGYRIVQYHVVAHYYVQGSSEILPHDLQRDEWSMPEWDLGFADPNETNTAFSAFTLLEEIAPGRAWINEINYCEPSQSASLANQWIELAVPSGVDMSGWTVEAYDYNGALVAELATLGLRGAPKSKTYHGDDPVALASRYAFYTIKSPYTVLDGADAVWPGFNGTGALDYSAPYAFALRRPTGIIEHRVVAQGWNQYRDAHYDFAYMYDGTNLVKVMHAKHAGEWTWSAEDLHGADDYNKGVSVVTNQGFAHEDWVSPLKLTPGDINGGQYISPDWYLLPNGGYVKIYSSVLGSHMRQIIGGVTNTVGDITISQGMSTNIVYEVDRWYKLGPYDVKPNERTAMSGPRGGADGKTYYTLSLNQVSNRIDITVRDDISDDVAGMLDPKYDAYRPAIMRWLERGVTGGADGGEHPFRNPNGPLLPMHYRGVDGTKCDEMKLPDLYWLDVDPTDGDWELWGGMGDRPGSPGTLGQVDCPTNRVKVLADGSEFIHTNHLTTVWLELRNTNEEYAVSYPPYRIQGLGNEQSDLYTGVWTSGNFKVTMRLANGKVDDIFQPMRYFVFDRESFRAKDDPVAPYAARVEIVDPFSDQSPAAEWGWQKYSGCNVFTGWALDGRVTPGGVSTLKKDDTFEGSW